jgi:hypothetical protein
MRKSGASAWAFAHSAGSLVIISFVLLFALGIALNAANLRPVMIFPGSPGWALRFQQGRLVLFCSADDDNPAFRLETYPDNMDGMSRKDAILQSINLESYIFRDDSILQIGVSSILGLLVSLILFLMIGSPFGQVLTHRIWPSVSTKAEHADP